MSDTAILEQALTLNPVEEGLWSTIASVDYEANTGMYGGWTAVVLLRAIVDDERSEGMPSVLTVNYVRRITPGSELEIRVTSMGGGRSITHWRSEIYQAGESDVMAYATVLMTNRKPSDVFCELTMPEAPTPESMEKAFSPPGTFGQRVAIKTVHGFPPLDQPNTRSLAWVRERSGREIDYLQLAFLSDIYPPRIWYKSKEIRPSSTITLSIYFHATEEELAPLGDSYILSEVTGTRAESSTVGSQANLWSPSGQLLLTTEQLHWFK